MNAASGLGAGAGEGQALRALVFDVDGTLADTEAAHRDSFNQTFEHVGIGWHWSVADYTRLLKVTGGKERIAAHIDTLELPVSEASKLRSLIPQWHAEKTRRYADMVVAGAVALRPGVAALLREAKAAGLRLGIATTTTRANIDALLNAQLGAASCTWFDAIACGDDVPSKKPAPDVYLLALRSLGIDATQAMAFEDSAAGLQSAVGAGLWTVITPTEWTAGSDFTAAAAVWSDLAAAAVDGSVLQGLLMRWHGTRDAHQNRMSHLAANAAPSCIGTSTAARP